VGRIAMDSKGEHLEYLGHRGLFDINCSTAIFSPEEIQILEKWGHWFTALVAGDLKPFTEDQERFIRVMKREIKPETPHEFAFFKYLGRKAVEKKYGDSLSLKYEAEHDTFYSREDKKKMNRITYGTITGIHQKGLTGK
jgi:uncharacterized protein YifE (UPF0438 family)